MLNISKIEHYLDIGAPYINWYDQETKAVLELLPEFHDLPIIRTFAVTSMATSIEANVHLAIKALLQMRRGQPFTGYIKNQKIYLNLIKQGKDVPGRKIMNFIRALEGDPNAVVVDLWMCRAFDIKHPRILKDTKFGRTRKYWRAPTDVEYTAIEEYCRMDAKKLDIEPRQYQSMIWAGIRHELYKTSVNTFWSTILKKKKGIFSYKV